MNRRHAWMHLWGQAADVGINPARGAREPGRRLPGGASPSRIVLGLLSVAVLVGGGRRLLRDWRSRRLLERLNEEKPTIDAIEESANYGRDALTDLFRILGGSEPEPIRRAAGRSLALLWKRDELVAEEEKAVVRRGLTVDWRARKRYPRDLKIPIPIEVSFGVPFLEGEHEGILDGEIDWSFKIVGAERASLEVPSTWEPGSGRKSFTVNPADFPTDGPHRLVLQLRARQANRNPAWEFDLPHMLFNFEFDPRLRVDSLLTLPDDERAKTVAGAIRLANLTSSDETTFAALSPGFVLRDPPSLVIDPSLPCDLAHRAFVEFQGDDRSFPAGVVVALARGTREGGAGVGTTRPLRIEPPNSESFFERPGTHRMRVRLVPDVQAAWADPDVRSLWPGEVASDWLECRVARA